MAEFTEKPGSDGGDEDTQLEPTGSVSVSNGDCGLAPDLAGSIGTDSAADGKPGIPRKASIIKVGTQCTLLYLFFIPPGVYYCC